MQLSKTGFKTEDTELAKEIKDKGAKKVFALGEIRLYECPLTYVDIEANELLDMVFVTDESGILPFVGGWVDQPAWFVEAYKIYKREIGKWRKALSRS